jgi:hypothetical protein
VFHPTTGFLTDDGCAGGTHTVIRVYWVTISQSTHWSTVAAGPKFGALPMSTPSFVITL